MKEIEFVISHCQIKDRETEPKFFVFLKEKHGSKNIKLKFPPVDFVYLVATLMVKNLKALEGFIEFIANIIPVPLPNIQTEKENDLFDLILSKLEARVVKCVMTDVIDNALQSKVVLQKTNSSDELVIPCTPPQGILYAFKSNAPIYFTEEALQKGQRPPEKRKEGEDLKERIKKIKPEEFGKFPQD